jgi:hypothetical protein
MKGENLKWAYSFYLLTITIAWASFTVWIVRDTVNNPSPVGVLETSGATGLLGALSTWNAIVIQHWFRKRPSNTETPSTGGIQ